VDASFTKTARSCLANGERLLSDARFLSDPDWICFEDADVVWKPTSFALAVLAEEEFAKGFLLFLVGQGVLPWSSAMRRAARDHSCKHLLSALMGYADPDIDEMIASDERSQGIHEAIMRLYAEVHSLHQQFEKSQDFAERKAIFERGEELRREVARLDGEREAFPPHIADAINILRHTKIGQWECGYAYDEERDYEPTARAIARGARDRDKQRALYIGVSKNGTVCSRPEELKKETFALAIEHSKRLGQFLSRLLDGGGVGSEFDRLIENLKVMFASQEELRIDIPQGLRQRGRGIDKIIPSVEG
jgi:AbiV